MLLIFRASLLSLIGGVFPVFADELPVQSIGTLEHFQPVADIWEVERLDGSNSGRTEVLETGSLLWSGDTGASGTHSFRQRAVVTIDYDFRYVGQFVMKLPQADTIRVIINGNDLGEYRDGEGARKKHGDPLLVDLPRRFLNFDTANEVVIEIVSSAARDITVGEALMVRRNGLANYVSPERINFLNGQLYTFFSIFMAYYTLIYFLVHRKEKFYLYFTIANLLFAIYFYRMAFSPVLFSFYWSYKISKAVLPLGICFFALSFIEYFQLFERRWLRILLITVGSVTGLGILLIPSSQASVYTFFGRSMLVLLPVVWFILYITLRAFRAGNPDAKIILAGLGIAVVFGLHDMVFIIIQSLDFLDSVYFAPRIWLQGIGLFIFNLTIFTSLALRSMRSRSELESYTTKVEDLVASRTSELDAALEKARQASNAKSDFLASMSHEMRTPLNAIMGFGEALWDNLGDSLDRQYAGLVVDESKRLSELIDHLLDLSKIEAGRLDLVEESFNLPDLLCSIEGILGPKAEKKGVALELHLDQELPRMVFGDSLRLRQVLINLIDNGIKFTEKGHVALFARSILESEGLALLEFKVSDSGIGIDEKHLKRLFDKFYQVEVGRTRSAVGFGLWTAISKLILDKMGGTITVSSTPGVGTTFFIQIYLRCVEGNEPEEPRVLLDSDSDGKLQLPPGTRVLVVDDYATNLKMVDYHLSSAGCDVECVTSGPHALDLIRSREFDLVLMDISMPGMDGCETTRRIRRTGSDVPVVAVTANAYHEDFPSYWKSGMNDILVKPFRKDDLIRIVARWCTNGEKPAGPQLIQIGRIMQDPPLLDYDQLIYDFDQEEETVREILLGFLLDTEERIPRIRKGVLTGDAETVQRESHALKGGAYNIRADILAAAAERLEQKAKAGLTDTDSAQFREIEQEFARLRTQVRNITETR